MSLTAKEKAAARAATSFEAFCWGRRDDGL